MEARSAYRLLLTAALAFAIGGCGAETGGDSVAGGGIGGTGISTGTRASYGTITGFGSIYTNGVRYGTHGAVIRKGNTAIAESELRVGMTVAVRGMVENDSEAVAEAIEVEQAVSGRVESKAADHIVVLGQTVFVDDATAFDAAVPDLAALRVGDVLEVHGLARETGAIEATFVQRAPPEVYTVRGFIERHDPTARTFTLGTLTVDHSTADISAMPAGDWRGLFVKAAGVACAAAPVCGTLSATEVTRAGLNLSDASRAEVEGFVNAIESPTRFRLANQTVATGAASAFVGGDPADIALGAKLEVQGSLSGNVLYAEKIVFKHNARLESRVDSVEGRRFTLTDFPGITIETNNQTRYRGAFARARGVAPGAGVRIRGRAGAAATVVAVDVNTDRPGNDKVVLQGPVLGVADPILTILGIGVNTSSVRAFRDARNRPITATEFFQAVRPGAVAKVGGRRTSSGLAWDEVELEN